jgi:Lipopolysaccharide-assembly
MLAALTGCGYAVGNAFQAPVETVSVSIVGSESFRRGLEFQLTDAIHREIQLRWPSLRIVHDGQADTRLVGRIIQAEKYPLTPTQFDDPRELEFQLAVDVRWEDLRTGEVVACQCIPISPDAIGLVSTATFAPETGQSRATAERKAVEITARQIVDLMETPW